MIKASVLTKMVVALLPVVKIKIYLVKHIIKEKNITLDQKEHLIGSVKLLLMILQMKEIRNSSLRQSNNSMTTPASSANLPYLDSFI